jgi:hypothetical protein
MNVNLVMVFLMAVGGVFLFRFLVLKAVGFSSKKGQTRLMRIRNASFIFQILIWISLIASAYIYLAFLFGWPAPYHDQLRIVISEKHIYTSPAEMPSTIYWLLMVRVGLGYSCMLVLLHLFRLYGRGILFSAQNVFCIRFIGYWLLLDFATVYQMQGTLHDMALSTTPVFVGLLIIFIAWIMDEGRKIQEEQELTV